MSFVRVVHKIDGDVELRDCKNPSFLLSNKKGGYLNFGSNYNTSRYQGCYFLKKKSDINWSLFKVIEDIKVIDEVKTNNTILNKKPTHLINKFNSITRMYDKVEETFFLDNSNAFVYSINNHRGNIELILDCREIHDFDDKGRKYNKKKEGEFIVIEYKKYLDNDCKTLLYKIYLVIKGCLGHVKINKWEQKEYEFDKERNSIPNKLYVYKALRIPVKNQHNLIFSYGNTVKEAKKNANDLDMNYKKKEYQRKEEIITETKISSNIHDEKIKLAYKSCIKSLDDLYVNVEPHNGFFAGFPWFYQYWTRDEAISTISLMKREHFVEAKQILFKQLSNLSRNGKIPNRIPGSELESADGTGWTFKRIYDLMEIVSKKKSFQQYFTENDVLFVKDKLKTSIVKHLKFFTHNGLAHNRKLETWMDTSYKDKEDFREGFRIEIQALRLKMYKLMKEISKLTKDKAKYQEYEKLERNTRDIVKKKFWKSPVLIDGIDEKDKVDKTIRPNIFIAYYVYPELLSNKEWEKCFDNALIKLWLDWGGLSSIDTKNKLFCDEHTGENNKSYHRGDSWYWINCLAAVCMQRLGKSLKKKKYEKYISKITDACCEEILFNGIIGHHAELSSAGELSSKGCLCQAWSSAMFVELIEESVFNK
ncbi:hypothetical protein HOL83_06665 [Candidatus Woesearchaeota archaeon]|jgi:glycogen debranching enzyme|nr:hypothetical protein [Candidatus Woesearchaeota archaeon]MBT5272990.1 hypothetical protein [Candidatus Woesearchaeota archaeon]MBT6040470.1 hypothetical protein [Candidatus Woesearchaeota archaeon]